MKVHTHIPDPNKSEGCPKLYSDKIAFSALQNAGFRIM